jgi:uncharacterized repeat protein (TIGR01451 family)
MKKTLYLFFILCLLFGTGMAARPRAAGSQSLNRLAAVPAQPTPATTAALSAKPTAIRDFGKVPIFFTPNAGQMNGPVEFYINGKDKSVYFTPEGVTYALRSGEKRWAVKMDFVGPNPGVKPQGLDPTGAAISYFKGKPKDWKAGLPAYSRIAYKDLWPGIDLIYTGQRDKLKYEFFIHPGADPAAIKLAWRGTERMRVDDQGRLAIITPAGGFVDETPVAYQDAGGRREEVLMSYDLHGPSGKAEGAADGAVTTCGFTIGPYDKSRDLVLDPATIVYCGYLGGSSMDAGTGVAVDGSGNAYVTGFTRSETADLPESPGPKAAADDVPQPGDDFDVFVVKVNPVGSAIVYAAFFGGSDDDLGMGIAVDGSGNAYVTGYTYSGEGTFPVRVGPSLTASGYSDVFVAKISAAGTALVYCGYIGGSNDDLGMGIAVDGSGNAYVTGYTYSDEGTFPVAVGPDLTFNDESEQADAFVAKVNAAGTALVYCGYIGGSYRTMGRGIAVDGSGNAYVAGCTSSDQTTFPVIVGPDLTYNGRNDTDAFVAKVNATGTALVYCGYIGGSGDDFALDIALDASRNAYVTGYTTSDQTTFPVTVGPVLAADHGTFIAKVNSAGTALSYCGYISDSYLMGKGIAVDGSGNAYVTGGNVESDVSGATGEGVPVFAPGSASAALTRGFMPRASGGQMARLLTRGPGGLGGKIGASIFTPGLGANGYPFVTKINSAGTAIVYYNDIGSSDSDTGLGIAVDGTGNAYVAGYTESDPTTFPVKVGPWLFYGGNGDAFVAKFSGDAYADIVVAKTADNLAPRAGTTFHFSVTATNSGPSDATGLRIKDSLPAALAYQSSTVSQGAYDPGTGIWNVGSLSNGRTATLTIAVAGTSSGSVTNTAYEWTMDQTDPYSPNDSASATVTVKKPYTLTIAASLGGTTSPAPGVYTYDEGTSVGVQANPQTAYQFDGWTGDASGSANPLTIVMTGNKAILANFSRGVKPPLALTVEKTTNRNVSTVETVVRLRWQANSANSGTISYRIYRIDNGQATLIASVGAGTYEYLFRNLVASKSYQFGVTAVNSQGWESDFTLVTVQ